MTDTVTEAAVEIAAKALYEVEWREALGGRPWDLADESERPYWLQSARAALEAALPLLVAGERPKLLTALKEIKALKSMPIGDTGFAVGPLALFNAAQRIAGDAIRADRKATRAAIRASEPTDGTG